MKKLLFLSLATSAVALFTACETDDDDDVSSVSTTTTSEERVMAPATTTSETRTIRSY